MIQRAFLTLLSIASLASAAPKTVYLTFDDGPHPATEGVLKVLADANDARAAFFVVGENVKTFPDATAEKKREAQKKLFNKIREKHQVGNHTLNHFPKEKAEYQDTYSSPLTSTQEDVFKKNFDGNLKYFRELISDNNFTFKLARLPGDGGVRESLEYLRVKTNSLGLKHVTWTFEFAPNGVLPNAAPINDWQKISGVAATYDFLPPDKAIILFHEHHWANAMNKLAAILKFLADRDYKFAVIDP